jgi:polyferredoxin
MADVVAAKGRKPWVRRVGRDHSQTLRQTAQVAFLALNVWICFQFYLFVRQFELASGTSLQRPPGVEGWLPIAGLMNLKYFLMTGDVPAVHPAAMFLIATFLVMSFVFRKAFCSWLCPIGTFSEWLWKLGRSTFKRNFALPRWLDIPLRGLKYLLLGFFLYAVISMPVQALAQFLNSPYGLVADVKMLNFFRFLSVTGAIVIGVLIFASIFVQNFWCRFLCPYGALMGLASLLSPMRIRRDPAACIDCEKCRKACPSQLPVDTLAQIRSAECLGCLERVAVCPAEGALFMGLAVPTRKPRVIQPWAIAVGIAVLFFGVVSYAKLTGHWSTDVSTATYQQLVPRATEFDHPR